MNFSKQIIKFKNGITLISLVITIILLLILAGISITILLGENGIINKALESEEKSEYAKLKEQIQLDISEKLITNNTSTNLETSGSSIHGVYNKEIKNILEKYGTIDRANLVVDNSNRSYPIQDLLGAYSNKNIPQPALIGYWENYVNTDVAESIPLKLSDISDNYDIINIGFARWDDSKNNGSITFEPNKYLLDTLHYSKIEFKEDIKNLQAKGKKVLISIRWFKWWKYSINK